MDCGPKGDSSSGVNPNPLYPKRHSFVDDIFHIWLCRRRIHDFEAFVGFLRSMVNTNLPL